MKHFGPVTDHQTTGPLLPWLWCFLVQSPVSNFCCRSAAPYLGPQIWSDLYHKQWLDIQKKEFWKWLKQKHPCWILNKDDKGWEWPNFWSIPPYTVYLFVFDMVTSWNFKNILVIHGTREIPPHLSTTWQTKASESQKNLETWYL